MNLPIQLTVALPLWRASNIAWLALESLCRQETSLLWELIVCEEDHDEQLGAKWLEQWHGRLGAAGCGQIRHFAPEAWMPLPQKWRLMGKQMEPSSEVFVLHAADCYSHPTRLDDSFAFIAKEGAHWYDIGKGVFYDIPTGRTILYSSTDPDRPHLNMAMSAAAARTIPEDSRRRGVDRFLFRHTMTTHTYGGNNTFKRRLYDPFLLFNGVDTNGCNQISKRNPMFDDPKPPFSPWSDNLLALGLPEDIVERLRHNQGMGGGTSAPCRVGHENEGN